MGTITSYNGKSIPEDLTRVWEASFLLLRLEEHFKADCTKSRSLVSSPTSHLSLSQHNYTHHHLTFQELV